MKENPVPTSLPQPPIPIHDDKALEVDVFMAFVRATKNTYRYEEIGPEEDSAIYGRVLYVNKKAIGDVAPKRIVVSIRSAG